MPRLTQKAVNYWIGFGARFLPFADAATPDLPLSRLLRLSLFQVSVGMALVLMVGTLNRVMIVELAVPAWLVAVTFWFEGITMVPVKLGNGILMFGNIAWAWASEVALRVVVSSEPSGRYCSGI